MDLLPSSSILDRLKVELERQCIAQGRYGARVDPEVKPLPRNRVAINITIKEGDVATISGVDIVGNTVFEDELLVEEFELKESHMFSFFKGDDKFVRLVQICCIIQLQNLSFVRHGFIGQTVYCSSAIA